jgi:hypothetical protein
MWRMQRARCRRYAQTFEYKHQTVGHHAYRMLVFFRRVATKFRWLKVLQNRTHMIYLPGGQCHCDDDGNRRRIYRRIFR